MARPETRGERIGGLRLLLATGFGTGYAPFASGTVGSLPGLLIAWAAWAAGGHVGLAAATVVVTAAGFWAAEGGARHFAASDPKPVVIDEIAGQLVTLLWLVPDPPTLALGFLLFRLFDVWKPFPARSLERLPGGSGIMTDDLMAGVYANLVLRLVLWVFPT